MIKSIVTGLVALGMSIPAFSMQSAQSSNVKSTENSCALISGSPEAGGFELVSTRNGASVGEVQITLWSQKPLRKAPQPSSAKQLTLVMPTNLFREPNRDSTKYLDGDKLGFSGQYYGKVVRVTNATFHFDQLNSDRLEIAPADLNDILRSDGISSNVEAIPIKLFEFPASNVTVSNFRACLNENRAVTNAQAPGLAVTRAELKRNVSFLDIENLMKNFQTRLLEGNPFPATINVELAVDEFGKVSQCRLLGNPGLDRFEDIKPKICPVLQRSFRFSPARDRDDRPVPDIVQLGAAVRSPCFGPGCSN